MKNFTLQLLDEDKELRRQRFKENFTSQTLLDENKKGREENFPCVLLDKDKEGRYLRKTNLEGPWRE